MGTLIRRTLTITLAETRPIIWSTENDPLHSPLTGIQSNSVTQEQPDEGFQPTGIIAAAGDSSTSAPATQPNGVTTKLGASSQRKRSRRRRVPSRRKDNQQST